MTVIVDLPVQITTPEELRGKTSEVKRHAELVALKANMRRDLAHLMQHLISHAKPEAIEWGEFSAPFMDAQIFKNRITIQSKHRGVAPFVVDLICHNDALNVYIFNGGKNLTIGI